MSPRASAAPANSNGTSSCSARAFSPGPFAASRRTIVARRHARRARGVLRAALGQLALALLFRVFFSRYLMGRLGRDPGFFTYVEGSVAGRLLRRARYAVTALDPAANPYLQWIPDGPSSDSAALALRPEHFETIRANLDRLEWHCRPLEDFLQTQDRAAIDRFNLSDIFEYMSPENTERVLEKLAFSGRRGGRLAYWNTLVPRRPPRFAGRPVAAAL